MERYPQLTVYLSPAPSKLPYADASFAAVLQLRSAEHVADPDASLEEVKRILARDHQDRLPSRPPTARRSRLALPQTTPPRHHTRPPPASPTASGTRDGSQPAHISLTASRTRQTCRP